jgi:hypothetical protein
MAPTWSCKWFTNNKQCKKHATKRAFVSYNPKRGEPAIFPICDVCAVLAVVHWTKHLIKAVVK